MAGLAAAIGHLTLRAVDFGDVCILRRYGYVDWLGFVAYAFQHILGWLRGLNEWRVTTGREWI